MTAHSVSRLSAPETVLWSRVGPAALFVVVAYTVASSIPSMWRANAWFEMVGALIGLWALAGFCLWNARAYDVWLSDDTLILRRGFRSIQIPLSAVTNIEVPMQSFQLIPIAWLHWRDPDGKRNTAQFYFWRSPTWESFRKRVGQPR